MVEGRGSGRSGGGGGGINEGLRGGLVGAEKVLKEWRDVRGMLESGDVRRGCAGIWREM